MMNSRNTTSFTRQNSLDQSFFTLLCAHLISSKLLDLYIKIFCGNKHVNEVFIVIFSSIIQLLSRERYLIYNYKYKNFTIKKNVSRTPI